MSPQAKAHLDNLLAKDGGTDANLVRFPLRWARATHSQKRAFFQSTTLAQAKAALTEG